MSFNVIEKKFPQKIYWIEPIGSAWAVMSRMESCEPAHMCISTQEDVFSSLDEARKKVMELRS